MFTTDSWATSKRKTHLFHNQPYPASRVSFDLPRKIGKKTPVFFEDRRRLCSQGKLATITLKQPNMLCNCHNPLQTGLKMTNRQHTCQSLLFKHQSFCTSYNHRALELPKLHIPHLSYLNKKFSFSSSIDKAKTLITLTTLSFIYNVSSYRSSKQEPL